MIEMGFKFNRTLLCFTILYLLLISNPASALEIKFEEEGKSNRLTKDAVRLFRHILPEAQTLNIRVSMIEEEKTAVMIVLFDKKTEDGFLLMKKIPPINSYTYMVAWLLQGHYHFLKDQASTPRQKKHLKLLSRYFKGSTISGKDTFHMGEPVKFFYQPRIPEVRGVRLDISTTGSVLYSGHPDETGFSKIMVPGFKYKYIAVFPKQHQVMASGIQ